MIRVGNAILNEEYVAAICPIDDDGCIVPENLAMRLAVHLSSGCEVVIRATMAEMTEALEDACVLGSESPAPQVVFTEGEMEALRSVHRRNFRFVAKDEDGKVFAYTERPIKGVRGWRNDDDVSKVCRIRAQLDCLSFDDDEPLSLETLFAEEDGIC